MPRIQNRKQPTKTARAEEHETYQISAEDNIPDSPCSSDMQDVMIPNKTANLPKKRKSSYDEEQDEPADFNSEMHKMLECFGADITKTLSNKRKRLEQFTQSSLKTSNRKVEEIWKAQCGERNKLNEEFKKQVNVVFHQWEQDLEKSKEQEDKLQNLFKQHQKLFQQTRVVQSQRLKTIQQLHEQYIKGMEKLEKSHTDQQTSVHGELKKEMALLQKKILMDTQQQEMANVRKSLQTMLF